jgi:hypothetical protein
MISKFDEYNLQKVYSKFAEPYRNTRLFHLSGSRHLTIFLYYMHNLQLPKSKGYNQIIKSIDQLAISLTVTT